MRLRASRLIVDAALLGLLILVGATGVVALYGRPTTQPGAEGTAAASTCSVDSLPSGLDVTLGDALSDHPLDVIGMVEKDVHVRYPEVTIVDSRVAGVRGTGLPLLDGKTVVVVAATGRDKPGGGDRASEVGCTIALFDALTGAWEMTLEVGTKPLGPMK